MSNITDGITFTLETDTLTITLVGYALPHPLDELLGRKWVATVETGGKDVWEWTVTSPCDADPMVEVRRVLRTVQTLAADLVDATR